MEKLSERLRVYKIGKGEGRYSEKVYNLIKNITATYVFFCLDEKPPQYETITLLGLATLNPASKGILVRKFNTLDTQPSYSNSTEKEKFKSQFEEYVKSYFDKKIPSDEPIFVTDESNLERCLNVLQDMNLKYEVVN